MRGSLLSSSLLARIAAPAAAVLMVTMLRPIPVQAADPVLDQGASDVVVGLLQLGKNIAGASAQPALSDKLPLTDISVRDVLQLDTQLGQHINDDLLDANATLNTLPGFFTSDPALELVPRTPGTGAPAGSKEWDLQLNLTGSDPVALTYSDDRMKFGAAQLTGEATGTLTGTVRIRYDASAIPLRRFSVVGESQLTTHVWTRPKNSSATTGQTLTAAQFPAVDGFVQLDAAGTGRIDTSTVLRLRDPNGRGQLTTEDLQFSTPEELFTTGTAPGADDVAMHLDLSSGLLSSGAHGSVVVGTRPSASKSPYAAPVITRDPALDRLTSLSRPQALAGFAQYATAMQSAEGTVDADLPLLDAQLTDIYSPATKLMGLLNQQATATITCGAADTSPPTGAPRPGEARYCQATTDQLAVDDGTTITWGSPDPGVTITGGTAGTVGVAPTSNVKVTGGGGFPRLTVTFTSDGKQRTARSLMTSIQDLSRSVDDLGLGGELSYDTAKQSLEVAVHQDDPDTATKTVRTGGNGGLAPMTGLTGLCEAEAGVTPRRCPRTGDAPDGSTYEAPSTGNATVTTSGRYFDATFGIGLVPPAGPLKAGDPAPATPVSYVKPGDDGLLWQVGSVSAAMSDNAPMVARIGFLAVDVDVTSYDLATGTGKAAASVSVPTGDVTIAGGTVSDAVDVTRLLGTDPDQGSSSPVGFVGKRAMTASADLSVQDSPTAGANPTRPLDADGTITASWTNLAAGRLPTVTTDDGYDRLRALDIVPSRQSVMGAGTEDSTLVDPTADFLTQFGFDSSTPESDRKVTRQFYDLDPEDNAATVCTAFTVVDAHTLSCTEGPLAQGGLIDGHRYVVNGEPEALRDILIEDMASVLTTFANPDPSLGADKTLPLLDLLPADISAARTSLAKTLVKLQQDSTAETPDADVSTLQGFSAAVGQHSPHSTTSVSLDPTTGRLLLSTGLTTSAVRTNAPLRVTSGDSELVVVDGVDDDGNPARIKVPVQTSSSADIDLAVDLANAQSYVGKDTSVGERVTGLSGAKTNIQKSLSGKSAEFGGTDVRTDDDESTIDLGIGVRVDTAPAASSSDWIPIADFAGSLEQNRSLDGAAATCAGTTTDTFTAACLTMPVDENDPPHKNVATVHVALHAGDSSGGTGTDLKAQPLAYRFLADGLTALSTTLSDALSGDASDLSMPLVGSDLDGSAKIPDRVTAYTGAVREALSLLTDDDETSAATLASDIKTAIDGVQVTDITANPVTVTVLCDGDPCADTDKVKDVNEVRAPISFHGTDTGKAAFQAGLAGIAVSTDLDVPSTTAWNIDVTVGIERGTGPFIVLAPAAGQDKVDVLTAHVTSALPSYSAATCHPWARAQAWEDKRNTDASVTHAANFYVPASQASTAKCVDAFVGKLPSVLVDRNDTTPDGHHTGLDAHVTVALSPGDEADDDGRVYLPSIFDKKVPFHTSLTGEGGLALYFESFASDLGFFDVMGTLDLDWSDGEYADAGLQYGNLDIDANTVYQILDVGYAKAKKWLAPLNPVVDVLNTPIPGISDLAKMVGSDPITLMFILNRAHTAASLIINLLQFQQQIARLPGGGDTPELVGLGSGSGGAFRMTPRTLQHNSCTTTATRDNGEVVIKGESSGWGTAQNRCDEGAASRIKRKFNGKAPEDPTAGEKVQKRMTKSAYFQLPTISVPVLEDANQVYNLLLGTGDTTLLHVDLGKMGIKASYIRNFGPLMIGPVPVVASVGGSIDLSGRFAFGFDTRGLSKQIELVDPGDVEGLPTLSRGQVFSDGFFIDDLDKGVDVPEIQLAVTLEAGASISIGFAEAGVRGGVVLDLSLDAFDPNGDGKIYTDEFAGSSSGPDCAFNVSSGLTFFLQFWFHVDLFLFQIDKSYDIVRSPRIKLFEFNCDPVTPKLAVVENGDLWLNMGTRAAARLASTDVTNEKFTVRQVAPTADDGTTKVEVSAFNLVQDYTVPAGGRIRATASTGDDTIKLFPGQVVTQDASGGTSISSVPFTVPANLDAGSGNDLVVTGDAADSVSGGSGNDSVDGGAGNDTVSGDDGDDAVDGGLGTDTINGGAGADRINGGPAADKLTGGDGDDVVQGGVGALPGSLFPTTDVGAIGRMIDSGDVMAGNLGSDNVDGGDGSDIVVGGDYDVAGASIGGTLTRTVFGVSASGVLTQVQVSVSSATLPTLAQVRTSCADQGASGDTGRDSVSGGPDGDYVLGGGGDDNLSGGAASDVVCGRGGNDVLDGDGADVPAAAQGDDEMRGGDGSDRLYGRGGSDSMYGDNGADLLRAGDGADALTGGAGTDLLLGEAGADTMVGDDDTSTPASTNDTARLIVCAPVTSVVSGKVDLNGDLSGNGLDDGYLEGMTVTDGLVMAGSSGYSGMLGGVVFINGKADLDGNGSIQARTATLTGDTGAVQLAGVTGQVGDGDCLLGGDDADVRLDGQRGGDYVDGGAGDEANVHGGSGDDLVRGGDGNDTEHGDDGADLVAGDAGDDVLYGDAGDDTVRGSSGKDLLAGGSSTASATDGADQLLGDGDADVLAGGNALLSRSPITGTAIPGVGVTLLATTAASGPDDQLFGGYGNDWVFGQSGDDAAYGGPDDDVVEGGSGNDTVQGDDGNDLLVGGSSTTGAVTLTRTADGVPDGDDHVVGDHGVDSLDGSDVLAGDNARLNPAVAGSPTRSRWSRIRAGAEVTLFDLATATAPPAASSGNDTMSGDGADDLVLGQGGNDAITGDNGNDAVEGGAGGDTVHGNAGDDEILGGSWIAGSYDGTSTDHLAGDDGNDVVLGDNGRIVTGATPRVTLLDVPAPGSAAAASTYGPDDIVGGNDDDTLFGQGGDDTVHGNDGLDAIEGDAGADQLSGDAGDDALTGGSSAGDGSITAGRTANGQLDAADTLAGGTGDDVLAGDNARIDRPGGSRTDGTTRRTVTLFDVDKATARAAAGTGAGDTVTGDDGRDLAFGQGGDDTVNGGAGDDYVEGNAGDDTINGGADQDDLVGGGSSNTGAVITGTGAADRLLTPIPVATTTDTSAAGMVDGNDTVNGDDGTDVVLGDNGRITRNGPNGTLAGGPSGPRVVRQVAMADATAGLWSGSDKLTGGTGDDELYGQFDNTGTTRAKQSLGGQTVAGDLLDGGSGDDALVGDQGVDVPTAASALGGPTTLTTNGGFVQEAIRKAGTLVRVLTQTQPTVGGDDVLLGGAGADSVHAGAGADLVNAGDDDDVVFGGDGADAIWGGLGHDRVFGGTGDDFLDLKKRTGDPALWAQVAPSVDLDGLKATVNGLDTIYGGMGHDALQGDVGDAGNTPGDRLIDWTGIYNVYLVCQGAYGAGKIQNKGDPSTVSLLTELARSTGSVGAAELALVGNGKETNPGYPGAPGNFTCEPN